MSYNTGDNNYNAFYWPCLPVAGMAYNQQVLPNNMNMNLMAAAPPRLDPQTLAAHMTLQNYYNNEAIAVAANNYVAQVRNKEKRRVTDEAADHDGKPPKKKVYKYYCSFENCTNKAVEGGVCWNDKTKRFDSNRVCIRHGAKVKRCSREGCTNQAQRGGVCYEHGATRKIYLCRVPNCTKQTQKGGLCYRHRNYVLPPQGNNNMLCGVIEDRGNQRNVSVVVEISDNEEGGNDGNESLMAIRKRKANVADQTERGLSIEDNSAVDKMEEDVPKAKDTNDNSDYDDPQKSSADRGKGNLKDDTEEDASGTGLQKEAEGEKHENGNEEERTPDNAPVDDGMGGGGYFESLAAQMMLQNNYDEAITVAANNYNASYWPCLPVDGMAYNQRVLPNMNMSGMTVAAPRLDIQVLAAQMMLQNYYNNEAIAVAANNAAMSTTATNTPQAGNNNKRNAADAAYHDSEPPKKKVYKYYCKFENCTNKVKKGGVCVRHGAKVKVKRCSRKGCEKQAQNGGVCVEHGATTKPRKLCHVPDCTNNQVYVGGVCYRHVAPSKLCRVPGCTNVMNQKGGVCQSNHTPPLQGNSNDVDDRKREAASSPFDYEAIYRKLDANRKREERERREKRAATKEKRRQMTILSLVANMADSSMK